MPRPRPGRRGTLHALRPQTNTNGQLVAIGVALLIAAVILAAAVFSWWIGQSTDGDFGDFNQ